MDGEGTEETSGGRRRFVRLAGGATLFGIAGCTGDGGDGTPAGDGDDGDGEPEEELPEGVSEEEFVSGPVPEPYRTAVSQGGEERDPDDLLTKADVQFQEAEDAVEEDLITPGPSCGNCADYIPDQNGDGFGACAEVEGYIDPEDWCAVWEPLEEES